MLHSGKCPKCQRTISCVTAETIKIKVGLRETYGGMSYLCPHCRSVLSVSMNQIVLNANMVPRLVRALRKL